MINEEKAKQKVNGLIKNSTLVVSSFKNLREAYVFYCKNTDKEAIPGGMIYAVNKITGKIGTSLISDDYAIKESK